MESRDALMVTPCEEPSRRVVMVSEKLRTISDAAEVSIVIAVRDARESDHRRASANVDTVSVAAERTLIRSRRAVVRAAALEPSMPAIVTTTSISGRVVPRGCIVPFRGGRAQHTIPRSDGRNHESATDIV